MQVSVSSFAHLSANVRSCRGRTRIASIAVGALLLTACAGGRPHQATGNSSMPGDVVQPSYTHAIDVHFFPGYFKRWPALASNLGDHRYDHAWPDLSPAAQKESAEWLVAMRAMLGNVPRDSLTVEQRVDIDIVADQIRLLQLVRRTERPYETNPLLYAFLLGRGLDVLVERDYAPLATRAAALAQRLAGLPTLVDQAVANLADASAIKAPQAKVSLGQLAGVKSFIKDQIPQRIGDAPADVRQQIAAATPPALAAIDKLIAHIKASLPNARGQWRLGKETFTKKLALTLQTDLTADQVYQRAVAEHRKVRQRMEVLARELYEPLFGAAAPPVAADSINDALIRKVLDALAQDHVEAEELRDACAENLDRLNAFVRSANIVPLDDKEVLKVIWTPPHRRGVAVAGLDAPLLLDAKAGLPSFYIVQPVPPDWPAERRESLLREYNHFMLEILSIHEAIPGHFVQIYYAKRDPSVVRKVFMNGPFVEGWAVYTERVMVDEGYVGKRQSAPDQGQQASHGLWRIKSDDALRAKAIALHGQKFFLRAVTNAIIDHEIHAGDMSEEAAVAFMTGSAFQEEGEARGKWVRAQVTSTQLSTYYVGATAWFQIREQAEKRAAEAGREFDLAEFHREALSHGSPPLSRLPELMGWN